MESVSSFSMSASKDNENGNLNIVSSKSHDHLTKVAAGMNIYETSSERHVTPTSNSLQLISSIALNDNKAGMEGLDRDRINKIIHEASKGSKFYENEKKKEEILNQKIKEQQTLIEGITASQMQFGLHQADQLVKELQERRNLSRTIVHVDMDAFYAAVEMRDNPRLKNKPMAVGSMSMLSTSNYIARRFGIRAAMPGFIGRKLCPELEIVQPNFEKYIAVSETVRQILALYDPNFLPMSLDEAYLDFTEHLSKRLNSPASSRTFILRDYRSNSSSICTCDLNLVLKRNVLEDSHHHSHSYDDMKTIENLDDLGKLSSLSCDSCDHWKVCPSCKKPFPPFMVKVYGVSVQEAVLEMRNQIEQRTQLTASAGIAPNTMLAKVCSDRNKPNGQFQIEPSKLQVEQFISGLPVRKIPGIGKVTEKLLDALGVVTCQDLYRQRAVLYHAFTFKTFHHFMSIAVGVGSSTVERDGERKSMSTEQTFGELMHPGELLNKCQELCHVLAGELKDEKLLGKTLTLKIKTVSFEVKTRTNTLSHYSNDGRAMFKVAKQLLETEIQLQQPNCLRLRLMGIKMSKLMSQTDYTTSVASYFDMYSTKDDSLRTVNLQFTDTVVDSESSDITSTFKPLTETNRGSCFLQNQDDDEDYNLIWEDVETNKESKVPHVTTVSTETNIALNNTFKPDKKYTINKQKTIVSCLRDYQVVAEARGSRKHSQRTGTIESSTRENDVNQTFIHTNSLVDTSYLYPSSSGKAISSHITEPSTLNAGSHQYIPSPAFKETQCSDLVLPSEISQHTGMILCPVCGQQKYQWPLDQLNAHVDMCLSRSTVRDILSDQHLHSIYSKKRSNSNEVTEQRAEKKSKTQHTLLSFFKK